MLEDVLFLSRLQFAITATFHFLFVPLTIGLSLFIAILETDAYKSGNSADERIAMFWNRLFLLNFAVGVATGIVMEFQFGMNWSEYSIFVGDVFGAPLAIETIFTFFIESTFIGLWIFGRTILPKSLHLACIWIIFAASCISAFCIISANSFMQNPVGYAFRNGRAELTDFLALITNPYLLHQYPHVISAAMCTAAFFVLGISAWKIRRKATDADLFEKSFRIALFMGLFGLAAILATGHLQGQSIAKLQPMKLAAMENLKQTADPAPLSIIPGIDMPMALSFMVHNKFSGEVKGYEDLQKQMEQRYGAGNYIPPVMLSYLSFRLMVACSFAMIAIILYGMIWHFLLKKNMHRKALLAMVFGIALPYIASSAGWMVAEAGRQPWAVYETMPTASAVSPGISSGHVAFSIIAFSAIYAAIAAIAISLMRKEIMRDHSAKKITKRIKAVVV